jgi:hypothetical protein
MPLKILKIINSPGSRAYPLNIRTALYFFLEVAREPASFTSTLSTLQEKHTVLLLELRRLSPRTKTSFSELQNPSTIKHQI